MTCTVVERQRVVDVFLVTFGMAVDVKLLCDGTAGQLLALIDLRLEEKRSHLNPDFDTKQLAELLGVSMDRLIKLFRNKSIYRTPEAYIDNLRTINAMRLLRTQPNYSIAAIAEESGFNHVRTLQRRILDVTGMTPVDYRALFTKDM